ncbi:MAG: RNA-binding S4 domain-containing protein [Rhodocyclaceae bacterium]|jgi:ribosome-associated protein|nr:RNA-binding S4 domain-containing protein [Rhodocyclaceae bacterium]
MASHRYALSAEFIELNVLLKVLGLISSGGAAKNLIAAGEVRVDGAVETRIRRKLRGGQRVELGDDVVLLVADEQND